MFVPHDVILLSFIERLFLLNTFEHFIERCIVIEQI